MNTRGMMELIVLNIGLDLRVVSPTLFAMLVLMAVVTTVATDADPRSPESWQRAADRDPPETQCGPAPPGLSPSGRGSVRLPRAPARRRPQTPCCSASGRAVWCPVTSPGLERRRP